MAEPLPDIPTSLNEIADEFTPPEGYRVEIIGGQLLVSPTPAGPHIKIASRLHSLFRGLLPAEFEVAQTATLLIPQTGERYIPDLVVFPEALLDEPIWRFPSYEALLTVEITSPGNADTDRIKKPHVYAAGEVPAYLLVDLEDQRWVLYEQPTGWNYGKRTTIVHGGELVLPAPFTHPLKTSEVY